MNKVVNIATVIGDNAETFHVPLATWLAEGYVLLNSGCYSTTVTGSQPNAMMNVPVYWAILKQEEVA